MRGWAAGRWGAEPAGLGPVRGLFFGSALPAGLGPNVGMAAWALAGQRSSVNSVAVGGAENAGLAAVALAMVSLRSYGPEARDLVSIAGGADSTSTSSHFFRGRNPILQGDLSLMDPLLHDIFPDPFNTLPNYKAESPALKRKITVEKQQNFASKSLTNAIEAQRKGVFTGQIEPIDPPGQPPMTSDEPLDSYRLQGANSERKKPLAAEGDALLGEPPHVAAWADQAAFIALAGEAVARKSSNFAVEIADFAEAASGPEAPILAPLAALRELLSRSGLSPQAIDYFEIEEKSALVPLVAMEEFGLDREKVNGLGGSLAFGNALGANGPRMVLNMLEKMKGKDKAVGVVVGWSSAGQATALLLRSHILN